MKLQSAAILLLTLLLIPSLTACSSRTPNNRLDKTEDIIEERLDNMEDVIEDRVEGSANNIAPNGTADSSVTPDTTQINTITKEKAEEIALTHAGFTSNDVSGLHTELEFDTGIYKYEVQFYKDYLEYDYDINAETGTIVSFDKDN